MSSPNSALANTSRGIISIKEARKLLGKDSETLTDTQISDIISKLHLIARQYLDYSGSKNNLGI